MRILFDQGTPLPLRSFLKDHQVSTAFRMGWAELKNGDLIAAAEAQFDVIITTDKNWKSAAVNRPPNCHSCPSYDELVKVEATGEANR